MQAVHRDVAADSRFVPFVWKTRVVGVDLTGSAHKLELRLLPDTPGAALASIANAAPGAEGISVVLDGADSVITRMIGETTMEALPAAAEAGGDLVIFYDHHVTRAGAGEVKQVWFRGTFTVRGGVTV